MTKKLTVSELMGNREKYEVKENVTEELYIERLESYVTIRKPERSLCVEGMGMTRDENKKLEADVYMVYNVITEPNLKDKELQKSFGCVKPTDIVEKIFDAGEIGQISQVALELAGYKKGAIKLVKDLKN